MDVCILHGINIHIIIIIFSLEGSGVRKNRRGGSGDTVLVGVRVSWNDGSIMVVTIIILDMLQYSLSVMFCFHHVFFSISLYMCDVMKSDV